jgi:hypothetical protein
MRIDIPDMRNSVVGLLLAATLLAGPSEAQMGGLTEPLGTAVAEDKRPPELRGAKDVGRRGSDSFRLYASIFKPAVPCPGGTKKPCAQTGGLKGRVHVGSVWETAPIAGIEVEQLWLLRSGATWTTRELTRAASGHLEFSGGPDWPAMEPVDVIVKLKDQPELLQVRFQRPYLQGG